MLTDQELASIKADMDRRDGMSLEELLVTSPVHPDTVYLLLSHIEQQAESLGRKNAEKIAIVEALTAEIDALRDDTKLVRDARLFLALGAVAMGPAARYECGMCHAGLDDDWHAPDCAFGNFILSLEGFGE